MKFLAFLRVAAIVLRTQDGGNLSREPQDDNREPPLSMAKPKTSDHLPKNTKDTPGPDVSFNVDQSGIVRKPVKQIGGSCSAVPSGCATMCTVEDEKKTAGIEDKSWVGDDWNDKVGAINVKEGCTFTAYEHGNYRGMSEQFTGGFHNEGDILSHRSLSSFKCSCPGGGNGQDEQVEQHQETAYKLIDELQQQIMIQETARLKQMTKDLNVVKKPRFGWLRKMFKYISKRKKVVEKSPSRKQIVTDDRLRALKSLRGELISYNETIKEKLDTVDANLRLEGLFEVVDYVKRKAKEFKLKSQNKEWTETNLSPPWNTNDVNTWLREQGHSMTSFMYTVSKWNLRADVEVLRIILINLQFGSGFTKDFGVSQMNYQVNGIQLQMGKLLVLPPVIWQQPLTKQTEKLKGQVNEISNLITRFLEFLRIKELHISGYRSMGEFFGAHSLFQLAVQIKEELHKQNDLLGDCRKSTTESTTGSSTLMEFCAENKQYIKHLDTLPTLEVDWGRVIDEANKRTIKQTKPTKGQ
eukprot:GEMP01028774.1.p1 GENE.GEMP01028774.1~~GEMP01028774.1.p1  ORF type:complete len:524 (+),score=58.17 GEMP01028774.1:199-1770(+)